MSVETFYIVLSIGLGVLLLSMAGLFLVQSWRGRRRAVPPAETAPMPVSAPVSVAAAEVIGSMAERPPIAEHETGIDSLRAPTFYPERDIIAETRRGPGPQPPQDEDVLHLLTDPATGLDNRWAWDRLVQEEDHRRRRYSQPVSVVVAELPEIDKLVQRVGREPVDRLIVAIGEALRRLSRSADRIARVDYARFYLLLPETDESGAEQLAERVRQACDVWLEAGAVALRMSMGWATSVSDEGIDEALARARERFATGPRQDASQVG